MVGQRLPGPFRRPVYEAENRRDTRGTGSDPGRQPISGMGWYLICAIGLTATHLAVSNHRYVIQGSQYEFDCSEPGFEHSFPPSSPLSGRRVEVEGWTGVLCLPGHGSSIEYRRGARYSSTK